MERLDPAAWENALGSELGADWIASLGGHDRGVDLATHDGTQVIALSRPRSTVLAICTHRWLSSRCT
jgi:hypothetical protein